MDKVKKLDLSHWNYRVFRYKTKWKDEKNKEHTEISYGVHETYYNSEGEPNGWTKDPIIVGDSISELYKVLGTIKTDITRFPEVLDYEQDTKTKES